MQIFYPFFFVNLLLSIEQWKFCLHMSGMLYQKEGRGGQVLHIHLLAAKTTLHILLRYQKDEPRLDGPATNPELSYI